jgi:hypothetical protein
MGRSDGGLAQLGERGVRNAEVEGSTPLPSTNPNDREGRGRRTLPAFVREVGDIPLRFLLLMALLAARAHLVGPTGAIRVVAGSDLEVDAGTLSATELPDLLELALQCTALPARTQITLVFRPAAGGVTWELDAPRSAGLTVARGPLRADGTGTSNAGAVALTGQITMGDEAPGRSSHAGIESGATARGHRPTRDGVGHPERLGHDRVRQGRYPVRSAS